MVDIKKSNIKLFPKTAKKAKKLKTTPSQSNPHPQPNNPNTQTPKTKYKKCTTPVETFLDNIYFTKRAKMDIIRVAIAMIIRMSHFGSLYPFTSLLAALGH
jgi:hypothetical protein